MLSTVVVILVVLVVAIHAMPSDLSEGNVYAKFNETLASCSYSATCSVSGTTGVCVSISAGCCSGTVTSNLCSGSSDIRCCTNNPCKTSAGQSGSCMQTSLCSSKGKTSVAGYCTGPSDIQCCVGGSSTGISRDEVISRAQDWVNRRIPYSQTQYTDGYRQDCSGYVSMAWKSSTSGGGHSTYDMQNICTKISKSEMKAGDAILNPSTHVLLFHKWVDSDTFYEYAEHEPGTVASHDTRSYSYYASNGYFPCRYNNIGN